MSDHPVEDPVEDREDDVTSDPCRHLQQVSNIWCGGSGGAGVARRYTGGQCHSGSPSTCQGLAGRRRISQASPATAFFDCLANIVK